MAGHPLDRAIAELRAELARRPDDAGLYGRLGALYYRRGDLSAAAKRYRRAVELEPGRAVHHNNLGNVLCDLGLVREGVACYERALSLEKAAAGAGRASPAAETNLELARLELRLVYERLEYLERAVKLEVDSPAALNALGCAHLLRGRREEALESFRGALRKDPENERAAVNLAFTHTLSLAGAGDPREALSETEALSERLPHSSRLWLHRGELSEAVGLFDEAAERYLFALRAAPYRLEVYDLLGRLNEAVGPEESWEREALELLAKVEEGVGRQGCGAAEELYIRAFVPTARARLLDEALPPPAKTDASLRGAVAAALSAGGQKPGREGRNSPEFKWAVRAAILRAELREAAGDAAGTEMVLAEAERRFPGVSRVCFERGGAAFRRGAITEALSAFERAALAAPEEAYVHHSLRFAFEGYRRWRTECVRFETAIAADPRDAAAHHHLALAALSVMKNEAALEHFTKAWELDRRLAEAARGRGRALERLGRTKEALVAYREALCAFPDDAATQEALGRLTGRAEL